MTVLLTPEGEPFWCWTYLPREQFLGLLDAASSAWAIGAGRSSQQCPDHGGGAFAGRRPRGTDHAAYRGGR
jgi:hypothetical protein